MKSAMENPSWNNCMPRDLISLSNMFGHQYTKTRRLVIAMSRIRACVNSMPLWGWPFIRILQVSFTTQCNIHVLLMKISKKFLVSGRRELTCIPMPQNQSMFGKVFRRLTWNIECNCLWKIWLLWRQHLLRPKPSAVPREPVVIEPSKGTPQEVFRGLLAYVTPGTWRFVEKFVPKIGLITNLLAWHLFA